MLIGSASPRHVLTAPLARPDVIERAFPTAGDGDPASRLDILRHLHAYYTAYLAGAQDFERVPCLNTDPQIREIERAWHTSRESRVDLARLPRSVDEFQEWFLTTARNHEQPDFCRYLEHEASLPEIALFVAAEELVDGRFDDLVALAQVGLSGAAKMTIAENYWDEMGRGDPSQVHTRLFASSSTYMSSLLAAHGAGIDDLECAEIYENACLLMSYGIHRHLIPRGLGAMGVLEQSASPRFEAMVRGCARAGVPDAAIEYQRLHINVDADHGKEWLENVLLALAGTSPAVLREICLGVCIREATIMGPVRSVTRELGTVGYAHGSIAAELGVTATPGSPWDSFARSWNDLPFDRYMADHGRYRQRRYAEFHVVPVSGTVELLPRRAYTQTTTTNYLNGGIERLFAPMKAVTASSPVLRTALCWACGELQALTGHPAWFAQVFQNRIICGPGLIGKPTPEGAHHDGVDYVLTVMVERHQVVGGVSVLYHDSDHRKLLELELDEAGRFLFNNDKTTLHAVTPINNISPPTEGHRDVLIAIFTHMEDGKIPLTG